MARRRLVISVFDDLKFWEAREGAPHVAVYSSNLDRFALVGISTIGFASRLLCGTVFCLDCADRRVSGWKCTHKQTARARQSSPPRVFHHPDSTPKGHFWPGTDRPGLLYLASSVRESDFTPISTKLSFAISPSCRRQSATDVQVVASRMAILPTAADNDLRFMRRARLIRQIINSVPTAADAFTAGPCSVFAFAKDF